MHSDWCYKELLGSNAAALAITSKQFFVAGGYNGLKWTNSCEMYDCMGDNVKSGVWRRLPDMPVAVRHPKAVVVWYQQAQYVLVAGEADGQSVLMCLHWEPRKWIWQRSHSVMASGLVAREDNLWVVAANGQIFVSSLEDIFHPKLPMSTMPVAPHSPVRSQVASSVASEHSSSVEGPPPLPPGVTLQVVEKYVYSRGNFGKQRYTGQIRSDTSVPHGQGLLEWSDKNGDFHDLNARQTNYHRGTFVSGRRHGLGELYVADQDRLYQGYFRKNSLEGLGSLDIRRQGFQYMGEFKAGQMDGPHGRCTFQSNGVFYCYHGGWKDDKAFGIGTIVERRTGRVILGDQNFQGLDLMHGQWQPPQPVAKAELVGFHK